MAKTALTQLRAQHLRARTAAATALMLVTGLLAMALGTVTAHADSVVLPTERGGNLQSWGYTGLDQVSLPGTLAEHASTNPVISIASGWHYGLGLTADGRITAWGFANDYQQLDLPPAVSNDAVAVTAVSALFAHSLAITADGRVTAWGLNQDNQSVVPAAINDNAADNPAIAVAAGYFHSLALTADGRVTAWGSPYNNLVAVPATLNANASTNPVTAISAGASHSLALTADGQVTAWGSNSKNQSSVPATLNSNAATNPVVAISAGHEHSLALTADGRVTAWGYDDKGQSSVPSTLNANASGNPVVAIAAGFNHSLALTADGRITAWGSNSYNKATVPAPVQQSFVTAISAGVENSFAISTSPAEISGTPTIGNSLTAAVPLGEAATYQWHVDENPIPGATAATLDLSDPAWVGSKVHAVVTDSFGTPHRTPAVTISVGTIADPVVALSGTPGVGQTLTAIGTSTPATTAAYIWRRGAVEVGTGASYVPKPADIGHQLSVEVTFTADGYTSLTQPPVLTETIEPGTLADSSATISGTPQVGQPLSARAESTPGADTISYAWTRGADTGVLSTGRSYTPVAADLGHTLTVTATLTRAGYITAVVSDTTAPITTVITAPNVTVTGTFKAGETLTATATPTADTTSYTWQRGSLIIGTGATYTTTDADEGHELLVTATVSSAHTTSATGSTHTPVIATRKAPTLALNLNKQTVRQGQSITITWDSQRATNLTSNWTRTTTASGTVTLRQTTVGTKTWTLTATNANGTTTATTLTVVTLPAKKLTVRVPKKITSGKLARFTVTGLAPGERFTAALGPRNRILNADATGKRTFTIRALLTFTRKKTLRFTVTGSASDRRATTRVTITPKRQANR